MENIPLNKIRTKLAESKGIGRRLLTGKRIFNGEMDMGLAFVERQKPVHTEKQTNSTRSGINSPIIYFWGLQALVQPLALVQVLAWALVSVCICLY